MPSIGKRVFGLLAFLSIFPCITSCQTPGDNRASALDCGAVFPTDSRFAVVVLGSELRIGNLVDLRDRIDLEGIACDVAKMRGQASVFVDKEQPRPSAIIAGEQLLFLNLSVYSNDTVSLPNSSPDERGKPYGFDTVLGVAPVMIVPMPEVAAANYVRGDVIVANRRSNALARNCETDRMIAGSGATEMTFVDVSLNDIARKYDVVSLTPEDPLPPEFLREVSSRVIACAKSSI